MREERALKVDSDEFTTSAGNFAGGFQNRADVFERTSNCAELNRTDTLGTVQIKKFLEPVGFGHNP
jgi:hypothetical protein